MIGHRDLKNFVQETKLLLRNVVTTLMLQPNAKVKRRVRVRVRVNR